MFPIGTILRLLEIALSGVAFIISVSHGPTAYPYGIWCSFTWIFCLLVSLFIFVMEITKLYLLLKVFLPDWEDFTCGMTMLCSLMMLSASIIYAVKYCCANCAVSIICCIISFAAFVVYLVDAVMVKLKCPSGYLSNIPGVLKVVESFVACILFAACATYFMGMDKRRMPFVLILCILVYIICFLVNLVIILCNIIKLLKTILCAMDRVECIFNILAVVLYLLAAIIWPIFGHRHLASYCHFCSWTDWTVVTVMTVVNLLLYIVDLILAILAMKNRI